MSMVLHAYGPRSWEVEQQDQGFKASLGYIVTLIPDCIYETLSQNLKNYTD